MTGIYARHLRVAIMVLVGSSIAAPLFGFIGVARRTARRSAVVTTGIVSHEMRTAAQAAPPATPPAAAPTPAAPAPAGVPTGVPPAGLAPATTAAPATPAYVEALPTGCTSVQAGGAAYFNCGGLYYQPAFQGTKVIYVVVPPPRQ